MRKGSMMVFTEGDYRTGLREVRIQRGGAETRRKDNRDKFQSHKPDSFEEAEKCASPVSSLRLRASAVKKSKFAERAGDTKKRPSVPRVLSGGFGGRRLQYLLCVSAPPR